MNFERLRSRAVLLVLLVCAAIAPTTAWSRSSAPAVFDVADRSDSTPWIAASGSFVAVTWGAGHDGKSDVFVAVSRDGGTTFGPSTRVNAIEGEARLGGEMPPRVVLSAREGSATPELVVLWTARGSVTEIKTARSHDGGRSFEAPLTLQSAGAIGDRGWPAVALGPDGTAHAIWLDHRGVAAARASAQSHAGHKPEADQDGATMAQRSGLYYASAHSKPTPERELTRGVCYCCKTALAAGADGALYAAWRHVYPGNLRDMAFAVSRDGGRSFSSPARVSEDGWVLNGCPDDGPAIALDAGGTVHIVWPTVIPGPEPEGALFYASTRDGRRFSVRQRIPTLGSPKPAHPQIAIDARGRIAVAWDEVVNGVRVAAVREMKIVPGKSPEFGEVIRLGTPEPSMYPVLASTDDGFVAVWATGGPSSRVYSQRVRLP